MLSSMHFIEIRVFDDIMQLIIFFIRVIYNTHFNLFQTISFNLK